MNRDQAIELLRKHAKAKPESYYAEPFMPHEWAIDAVMAAPLWDFACNAEPCDPPIGIDTEPKLPAWQDVLCDADQLVRQKPTWARFIKGTPLENDVPVWIADFALRMLQRERARASEDWPSTKIMWMISKTRETYRNSMSIQMALDHLESLIAKAKV